MNLTDTQELVYKFYKDDTGQPILLSGGEDEIFSAIAKKTSPRLHIMCHTRYGKSMSAGLAVLTRAASFPEKWAIVAGTKEKAHIIMAVINAHIFDNDYIKSRYMPDKGESLEELRRYRNKRHVTFKIKDNQYSEVFIGSGKEAMGFGAPNVVEDEAALIDDNDHSFVMRMLGDNPIENFLCKIGNPFNRNHFLASFKDPAYQKVIWDCYRSLNEGLRISQQVIDENKNYSFFKVLYECRFPEASEVDESGWMYLFTDEDVSIAENRQNQPTGIRRLGLDVARGGRNYNCWVLRTDSTAQKELDKDTKKKVSDFSNVRAEVYAGPDGLLTWIKSTGLLIADRDWIQLTELRYRKDSGGKIRIEPKEDVRKRGVESPDVADALALTFAKNKIKIYHGIDPAVILQSGVKPFYKGLPG